MLAEVTTGRDALEAYSRGIIHIQRHIDSLPAASTSEQSANISAQRTRLLGMMVEAYVSLAELYMTDLCDEENAETECTKYALQAVEIARKNSLKELASSLQMLASLYTTLLEYDHAKSAMTESVSLWYKPTPPEPDKMPDIDGNDDDDAEDMQVEDDDDEPVSRDLPSLEYRLQTAKLCIELELYETALGVLDQMLEEHDLAADVWYMHAVASYHCDDRESCENSITNAQAILSGVQEDPDARTLSEAITQFYKQINGPTTQQ